MENGGKKNNIEDLSKIDINEIKFCKNHNIIYYRKPELKDEKDEQHLDCDICPIKDIEEEKRNILKENIKSLENLSYILKENENKLNILFDKLNENKEELKTKIQKIFTKIRSSVNDREDDILQEVDKTFDDLFFNRDIIKEGKKLSNQVNKSLDNGKSIDSQWNSDKLYSLINQCLNIENNIKEINIINEKIKKFNPKNFENIKMTFVPEENELNYFLNEIMKFGKISYNQYSFKKCPINISEERKFFISGEKENIITKVGTDYCWMGTICEKKLDQSKEEHIWKIKILNTYNNNIMIGIATIDFDINSSSYEISNNKGWYFYCNNGTLYSGPPHYFQGKRINLKPRNNEIKIVMNIKKRTLKFINDREDNGESYTDIPLDKPIFPSILLRDVNDSVEIIEC